MWRAGPQPKSRTRGDGGSGEEAPDGFQRGRVTAWTFPGDVAVKGEEGGYNERVARQGRARLEETAKVKTS
jgi:hypothetical protein